MSRPHREVSAGRGPCAGCSACPSHDSLEDDPFFMEAELSAALMPPSQQQQQQESSWLSANSVAAAAAAAAAAATASSAGPDAEAGPGWWCLGVALRACVVAVMLLEAVLRLLVAMLCGALRTGLAVLLSIAEDHDKGDPCLRPGGYLRGALLRALGQGEEGRGDQVQAAATPRLRQVQRREVRASAGEPCCCARAGRSLPG